MKNQEIEINAWYTPINAPKYWMELIGRSTGPIKRKGEILYRIEFVYRKDGSRLDKKEYFDFPATKLKLVTNFATLVRRRNPPPVQVEVDDFEEVVAGRITADVAAWHKDSEDKEIYFVLRSNLDSKKAKEHIVLASTSEALPVASTSDEVVKVAVNIAQSRRFVVGPHFVPSDIPVNWMPESLAGGNNCMRIINPARKLIFLIFPRNAASVNRIVTL